LRVPYVLGPPLVAVAEAFRHQIDPSAADILVTI
jgi:hypothetical protein